MKQMFRLGPFVRTGLWLALVLAASGAWIGHAQQPAQQPGTPAADDPHFTGLSTMMESNDLGVSRRRFEAGAHSAWHTHERGQLIFVEQGRARTQKRGQPIREVGVGESDYTGANIEHWHGAVPDQPFVQVAVGWGGATNWLQRTTDDEYAGKKK